MRNVLRRFFVVVVVLAVASPAMAATPSEFYLAMLRRGIGAYEAGQFDAAVTPLKIAAFGLVDSIEHYQIAQVHLALTYDRLGNAELSREAARRVVIGERIEVRYASLPLAASTRTNFQSLAQRVLTPPDVAILERSSPSPAPSISTAASTSPSTAASGASGAPASTGNTTPPVPAATKPAPPPEPANVEDVRVEIVKAEPVKPEPAKTEPVKVKPDTAEPVKPEPQPAKIAPVQAHPPPAPKPLPPPAIRPPLDAAARFAAAEQALTASRLPEARAMYRELLEAPSLQRSDLLRLAEGFYRSRDFANALRAFDRLGALRRGEEPYRYYIAVALYETAQYSRAKAELAAVLPFIEETPDVTGYRLKIEGAIN